MESGPRALPGFKCKRKDSRSIRRFRDLVLISTMLENADSPRYMEENATSSVSAATAMQGYEHAFICKNSFCCGVMHQIKKLVFDVLCFLREVVNLKAERIPCELLHWVVAFEIWKIVPKLIQQHVEVNDGFVLENVADATSSLADSRQRWKGRCTAASLELALPQLKF